jgi:hypothetical protein
MVGNFDVYVNVCWNGKYPRIAIGVKCKILKIHGNKIPLLTSEMLLNCIGTKPISIKEVNEKGTSDQFTQSF